MPDMGHRHMGNMESDRDWNHAHPDPRLHLENGSFVLPVESTSVSISMRSNGSSSSEIPNYRVANARPPHDPYMPSSSTGNSSYMPSSSTGNSSYMLPSSTGNSSYMPPSSTGNSSQVLHYVQHGPPCYNQFSSGVVDSTGNPYERAPFKRKTSMTLDSRSSSYYSAGSSSSHHVPIEPLPPKPVSAPQFWPMHQTNTGQRSNNLVIPGEDFQRNVRSRHTQPQPHHPAIDSSGHVSSGHVSSHNVLHHIPTTNISAPVARHWRHTQSLGSRRRIPYDVGSSSHATDRPLEIAVGYHSSSISSRNMTSTPVFHAPSARGTRVGHIAHHAQRITPYRTTPSYRPVGFVAGDGRRLGVETASRHSRPLSMVGRNSDRIERARNLGDRSIDNGRNRWLPEGVAMMNRLSYYDSRNFFDQHRDMRLDIDNMSYEELLALGERMGDVKTGLSEETVSGCLTETSYSSPQVEGDEEESCVICLEEYEDGESIGRLKCRHEFHVDCIKKWLLKKNVCPICKASAAEDPAKEG